VAIGDERPDDEPGRGDRDRETCHATRTYHLWIKYGQPRMRVTPSLGDRILRPVHRWVWRDPARRARKLLAFARTEADGGRDLARAAELTPDAPPRRPHPRPPPDEQGPPPLFNPPARRPPPHPGPGRPPGRGRR